MLGLSHVSVSYTHLYTASALSFMLENLTKPVILTGSQLPLFETRNDARENLINAILIAGNYKIPEVCIYFNNKLFRGNRSKKIDEMCIRDRCKMH